MIRVIIGKRESLGRSITTRILASILITAAFVPMATGCAVVRRPEQRSIDQVEDQLELDQLSDVICDFSNNPLVWEPQHPVRALGVVGVDNADEIVDRLKILDSAEEIDSVQTDRRTFLASDATVRVLIFEFRPTLAGTIPNFGGDDCLIPDDGMVGLHLTGFAR